MTNEEIRAAIISRVKAAMDELHKDNPDMMEVRDKLCDAAQFTHFREDGTRTDQLSSSYLMKNKYAILTRADVDVLDGSINRSVRMQAFEDSEVKRLYRIYKQL